MTDLSRTALRSSIREKVSELARGIGRDAGKASDTDILLELGIIDSAAVIELIVWLEELVGTEIDPGDLTLENFGSIDLMVEYLIAHAKRA